MKIATFNINGIRSRLDALLAWLERESPDVVCLQELKCTDEAFPIDEIRSMGYDAIWHGQASWNGVAILSKGSKPLETRRGLRGMGKDTHSRYLEAAVHGIIVGCLYLPNGNPQPGPKFTYKLAWFDQLLIHAQSLMDTGHPVVLAGDYNIVPTDHDIYRLDGWRKNALLQPEARERYEQLVAQGWTDALRHQFPEERIYTFWDYFRDHFARDCGLRIDHLLLTPDLGKRLKAAGVDRWVRGEPHASDHAPTWIEIGPPTSPRTRRKATRSTVGKTAAAKRRLKAGAS
jgi:exodeoxyribonuclease-3